MRINRIEMIAEGGNRPAIPLAHFEHLPNSINIRIIEAFIFMMSITIHFYGHRKLICNEWLRRMDNIVMKAFSDTHLKRN